MNKLNERRVNPDLLNLNYSQKRVLKKTAEAEDPKRAAEDITTASDSRNLIAAVKVLSKYGLVVTYPEYLGDENEPAEIQLTNQGQQHADDYDVTNDPTLVTQDEKEQSAPEGQPAETGTGELEMEIGAEQPATGQEMGLELSSFFQDVHNLSRLLKG